jgi:hypothetical protein
VRIVSLCALLFVGCLEDARPAAAPIAFVDSVPAPVFDPAYTSVVERVAGMVGDGDLSTRVRRRGGAFGSNDATVRVRRSDVERAVLGHGVALGPFAEGYGTKLVRDARFPIRITVQFYKATATGDASDADLDAIRTSIASVYAHADVVGSLVLPAGDTRRPTAWQHVPGEWFPW